MNTTQKFSLGRTAITPDALDALVEASQKPQEIYKHLCASEKTSQELQEFYKSIELLDGANLIIYCLTRHMLGDWGDVSERDRRENEFSVKNGLRILSAYQITDDVKVWVITEANRSVTTILLPDEY